MIELLTRSQAIQRAKDFAERAEQAYYSSTSSFDRTQACATLSIAFANLVPYCQADPVFTEITFDDRNGGDAEGAQ